MIVAWGVEEMGGHVFLLLGTLESLESLGLGTLKSLGSLVYCYMLVVVLGEYIQVIWVEGDFEVVVVASIELGNRIATGILQRAEFELVLRYYAFAGEVGIGGIILVVDVVGTLNGVLGANGCDRWVNVGIGNERHVVLIENFFNDCTVGVIEFDASYLYIAYLVVLFVYLEGEAEECLGVMQGELHVKVLQTIKVGITCKYIAVIIYGCCGCKCEIVTLNLIVFVYCVWGV